MRDNPARIAPTPSWEHISLGPPYNVPGTAHALFADASLAREAMAVPHLTESRSSTEDTAQLMRLFAWRTGLSSGGPQRRYLWTDAFAVCNFLGLARQTGEKRYTEMAIALIDHVHHVLGRHRRDDARTGWISGLLGCFTPHRPGPRSPNPPSQSEPLSPEEVCLAVWNHA